MADVWKGYSVWASGDSKNAGQWVSVKELGQDRVAFDKGRFETAVMTVEEARSFAAQIMNTAAAVARRNAQ